MSNKTNEPQAPAFRHTPQQLSVAAMAALQARGKATIVPGKRMYLNGRVWELHGLGTKNIRWLSLPTADEIRPHDANMAEMLAALEQSGGMALNNGCFNAALQEINIRRRAQNIAS